MFIALGLSGLIPAVHYIITFGSYKAFNVGGLGWLILMAAFYITGACLYAARIPERLFPGKFDIWVSSLFLMYYYITFYFFNINFFSLISSFKVIKFFTYSWSRPLTFTIMALPN